MDELPAETVISRSQRLMRWMDGLPAIVLGIPITAAVMVAGAFGIVGVGWVAASGALLVACVLYTAAGLETDDAADGGTQATRRSRLRPWLRMGANAIFSAVGIAGSFFWFDELGRGLPPWGVAVVFGLLGLKALHDHFRSDAGETAPESDPGVPVVPPERIPRLKPLARVGCVLASIPILGQSLSLASPLLSVPALIGVLFLLLAGTLLLLVGVTGVPRTRDVGGLEGV